MFDHSRKKISFTSCTGKASQIPLERAWMMRQAINALKVWHWLHPIKAAKYTTSVPSMTGLRPNFMYIGTVTSVPRP